MPPQPLNILPPPDPAALAHSQRLQRHIAEVIAAHQGWISFAHYMELALYAPGLGYYTAGAQKFGGAGDFVTAPEMTPLFAQTLANQVMQVMAYSTAQILEVGAGSGRLAVDLLLALEKSANLPDHYYILELSPDLRERQQELLRSKLPHLYPQIVWLETLPVVFNGVILANEVLDAMPVHLVVWAEQITERGVALDAQSAFCWQDRPATGALLAAAGELAGQVPPSYQSEIALAARAWVSEWGKILQCGALILVDYGFPGHEFYHPQRHGGTLMCHYRHAAHPDPFYLPGLQDITAHVDFTAIISAAHAAGLSLLGYSSQAQALMNGGLLEILQQIPVDSPDYPKAVSAVNTLTSPAEMGELFKVMAVGRNIEQPLRCFLHGDRSHKL